MPVHGCERRHCHVLRQIHPKRDVHHQGSVMHVLKLDTYQYVPIPPLRIGMYCGMYFCTYWWYVLIHTSMYSIHTSMYWYVFNTYWNSIEYVLTITIFDTYQYILQYMPQYVHQYGAVVLVCIQYIPVRIDAYLVCIEERIQYVLINITYNTCKYMPQYVHQYGAVVLVCIQYIPARIGMYSGMYFACIVHLLF
jgi:hypothetical protein